MIFTACVRLLLSLFCFLCTMAFLINSRTNLWQYRNAYNENFFRTMKICGEFAETGRRDKKIPQRAFVPQQTRNRLLPPPQAVEASNKPKRFRFPKNFRKISRLPIKSLGLGGCPEVCSRCRLFYRGYTRSHRYKVGTFLCCRFRCKCHSFKFCNINSTPYIHFYAKRSCRTPKTRHVTSVFCLTAMRET